MYRVPIKMLVVDDEMEICEFLKTFFEDKDFHVTTASGGEEALKAVASLDPHIVLLDVQMPGLDGIETLAWIKKNHPQVKVIMVTAIETNDKIERAMRLGADNYITKPLSLEYLEKEVHEKISHLTRTV